MTARPRPIPAPAPRVPTTRAMRGFTCRPAPAPRSQAEVSNPRPNPAFATHPQASPYGATPMPTIAPRMPLPPCAGIGLRHPHMAEILEQRPSMGWVEVHAENFMNDGPAVSAL